MDLESTRSPERAPESDQLMTTKAKLLSASLDRFQPRPSGRRLALLIALVFLTAFGSRVLYWQDFRVEAAKVEWNVTAGYKSNAEFIVQDGLGSLLSSTSRLGKFTTLKHPPGYALLRALILKVFGDSDTALLLLQITFDSIAAVVVFLIALEMFPLGVAVLTGFIVALAPQFAWHTIILLPDGLSSLPILFAVYILIRSRKSPHLVAILIAGALVGLSCWFRPTVLFLPLFLSLIFCWLFPEGKRLRLAGAFLIGSILMIAPVTIRNAVVYRRFIPLSLSAGHTLLIGIAEYDKTNRFGLPRTDLAVQRTEAQTYNRPDYANGLFDPDGIQRERDRLARGFGIIKSDPLWFAGVMLQRASTMFRLERVKIIGPNPAVTHSLLTNDEAQPSWLVSPAELLSSGTVLSSHANASLTQDGQRLQLSGPETNYGDVFASTSIAVLKDQDYELTFPFKIEQGRMLIKVVSADTRETLSTAIIETFEGKTADEQSVVTARLQFVTDRDDHVRMEFGNEASPVPPTVQVGEVRLYDLGPTAFRWTRYPRFVIRNVEKIFKTAVMLPFLILGIALLVITRRTRELTILLTVPAYYLCVQSAFHTEYRYVLTIHYFFFILIGVVLYSLGFLLWQTCRRIVFKK